MDGVLKSKKIEREAFHGGKLNGNQCGNVAQYCEEIVEGWRAVMKTRELRRTRYLPDDADAEIDELLDTVLKLLNALHRIIKVMATVNHQHDDGECQTFEDTVNYFTMTWRQEVKKLSIPPKFHGLEAHVVSQFWYLRNIGDFAEEVVESSHHVDHNNHKTFASISDYYERCLFIHHRESQAKHPDVVAALAAYKASAKRKFSTASIEKRAAKEQGQIDLELARDKRLDALMNAFFTDNVVVAPMEL
jgi:hypothetical protein